MIVVVFFIGLMAGTLLYLVIELMTKNPAEIYVGRKKLKVFVLILSGVMFSISYIKTGFGIIFFKALVFDGILIIASVVDLKKRVIPDYLSAAALIAGLLFLPSGDITLKSALLGMLAGGGSLFLLAAVPGAIGGGDIKMMFALGLFLGFIPVLKAIILAFIVSVPVSIFLIISGLKGRKDHIPFGPFLALGSFIAYHFLL